MRNTCAHASPLQCPEFSSFFISSERKKEQKLWDPHFINKRSSTSHIQYTLNQLSQPNFRFHTEISIQDKIRSTNRSMLMPYSCH